MNVLSWFTCESVSSSSGKSCLWNCINKSGCFLLESLAPLTVSVCDVQWISRSLSEPLLLQLHEMRHFYYILGQRIRVCNIFPAAKRCLRLDALQSAARTLSCHVSHMRASVSHRSMFLHAGEISQFMLKLFMTFLWWNMITSHTLSA